MDDTEIISAFENRSDFAIPALEKKYKGYCHTIVRNILGNDADAEECLDDTWLAVWNAIPPEKPHCLCAYVGKIARNLALNLWKKNHTQKRGELPLVLGELEECVSGGETPEDTMSGEALKAALHTWLTALSKRDRQIFLLRYWYATPVGTIAEWLSLREGTVSMILTRLRRSLKENLTSEGFLL